MKSSYRLLYWILIFVFLFGLIAVPEERVQAAGGISLTVIGTTYTQNFDTLANTSTTNDIDALNNGWYLTETGGGASFTNATGTAINALTIAYTGEEWRLGTAGRTDQLTFEYSTNAASLTTGTWTGVSALNFVTPDTAAAGAKNGNAAGERTALSAMISGLSIANRATFWIRWTDSDATSYDDGLAIDDFSLTVNQASTTTAITADTPDPSVVGQSVTFNYIVSVVSPGTGTPTGNVTVSNGTQSCTGTVAAGSCSITFTAPGTTNFTATYAGDANFAGSTSGMAQHTVNPANTVTMITSDAPDPSIIGGPVTINFTVTAFAPGAGTPTGDVTVSDGTDSCTGTVAAGSCTIAFSSPGAKTLTASYAGDGNFNGSISGTQAHTVTTASTTINITSDAPDSSIAGIPLPVVYTVTVAAPGTGTPTGSVTVTDGVDSCTGTVAAGTCNLTLTTVGGRFLTATYSGDANFGGSTSLPEPHTVAGPPAVTLINSNADTGDGQVTENEHASVAITQLLVVFNKDMNADTPGDLDDALTVGNYHLVQDGSTVIPIQPVITYNAATDTATLDVNGSVALPDGRYTLTVLGRIEDTLGAPIGTDFVRRFVVDSGNPYPTSIVTIQGNRVITNGATINARFSNIDITFNEDLSNAGGGAAIDDVSNPLNYLLLQTGPNAAYETADCQAFAANGDLPLGDDLRIPTGPVTYTNNGGAGPFIATVQLNGGTALANGAYRLLICGTTSIVDLAGNALNGGADSQVNFNVLVLDSVKRNPQTGFAPGVVTVLPEQPAEKMYADLGNLWIEIPAWKLKTSITGVPLADGGWDVTWLNRQVGWLEGTAYPTWEGNTVLTAHGYTADGNAGPFALLQYMKYGDTIIIHLDGMQYTYAIRMNLLIKQDDTRWLAKHEKLDWVTLITCQQYDEKTRSYRYRRVVRAVLISAEQE